MWRCQGIGVRHASNALLSSGPAVPRMTLYRPGSPPSLTNLHISSIHIMHTRSWHCSCQPSTEGQE
jgi:hypothetical protein